MVGSQDWITFIPDILSLSQDSSENLNTVLEIFSVLSKELQAKGLSRTQENVTALTSSLFMLIDQRSSQGVWEPSLSSLVSYPNLEQL